jgi:hypothetical protein
MSEQEVRDKVLKMIQKVCPKRYGVQFRRIRQLGDLWEADGTYRSPDTEVACRFMVRFSARGTVRYKDIEPP